jgi:prepilin-type N-terminal cleavage/methylation domain-containing protein
MYKKGFTLLELLVVVIIIGILASIALPQYTATIEKARSGEAMINIGAIRVALDRYWYQNGSLPADSNFSLLDVDNPNNIVNKLYVYLFIDNGTTSTKRKYNVTATRVGDSSTWVRWTQADNITGKLTRSENLGGPVI